MLEKLLRWAAFPAAFRVPLLAAAVAVALLALRPPQHSEMNIGAALVWQIWWPLLPFLLLPAARLWCAVCPFAAVAALAEKLRRGVAPLPPPRLRRLGPWLATASLALMGLLFLILSLEANGRSTVALFVVFALGAGAGALYWRGNPWCRYLCPVGLMLGLYSRLSWLRLEPVGELGRKASVAGAKVCPVFTSPFAARRSHDCVLCANCLRVPGAQAVAVRWERRPVVQQSLARPEAVAVSLLMGLLLADTLRMTPIYVRYMAWAVPRLQGAYEPAMALGIIGVVGLLALGQAALVRALGGEGEFWPRFARFSAALLPLALATQLALSTQHLLVAGEVIRNLGAEVGLVGAGHMPPEDAYSTILPVKGLQWLLLGGGVVGSAHLGAGARGREGLVQVAAAAGLGLALLALFAAPMSVTC